MDKKVVIGGTAAAALAAAGLYAVGKEAADNSAKMAAEQPAITAPAVPAAPAAEEAVEAAPANEAVQQSEQTWGEWFSSWMPNIQGPSFEEETPADLQRKNLENNY